MLDSPPERDTAGWWGPGRRTTIGMVGTLDPEDQRALIAASTLARRYVGRRKTYPTPRTVWMNAGVPGSRLDAAAQPMDVDIDRARLAPVVIAPDVLEQLVAREHLARVTDQERQQLERLWLDGQHLAVAQQAMAGRDRPGPRRDR